MIVRLIQLWSWHALAVAVIILTTNLTFSAAITKELEADHTMVYKQVGDVELKLHIFNPEGHAPAERRPAILFFFGGGWVGGTPSQFYPHCAYLASRGMVAISAEYRTRSQHGTSPRACVMDGKSALRFIRKNAEKLGIDPNRLAAGGGSAGGHIAAAVATTDGFEEEGEDLSVSCRPDALVLFNPVFDNGPEGYGHERVKAYWREISPLHNLDSETPPTLVMLGTRDRLIPVTTAENYQKMMQHKDTRCDLKLYKDQKHGFFNVGNRANYTQTVTDMDRFLESLGYLEGEPTIAHQDRVPTLRNTFVGKFYVGAALSTKFFGGEPDAVLTLVREQFNSISPENAMKWGSFNPEPGEFNHDVADAYVAFGRDNDMYTVGHVLFWHNQTPDWVFEDERGQPLSREALLERMRERVQHVSQRYGDQIDAWDVVNEAFLGDGRLRDSRWRQIIGDDWIEQAFRIAQEEFPENVDLLYNDYGMIDAGRRDAVVKMVRDFKAKGVKIDGVGMQGHWALGGPSLPQIETSIIAFVETGVDVHITELDIDVLPRARGQYNADIRKRLKPDPKNNPYVDGLPDEMQQQLAKRYADLFELFLKHHDKIKRVTFWGVTNAQTWLNNWPIQGRTNYPLLFDRQGRPTPAFDAVIEVGNKDEQGVWNTE